MSERNCTHPRFTAQVDVTRVLNGVEEDEGGEVVCYAADIRVHCDACGEPFLWRGCPVGISVNGRPMRSMDGQELRAWLVSPAEVALLPDDAPPGMVAP